MGERLKGQTPGGERDVNLDFIRGFAGFAVLAVHFFVNCGYYAQPMEGLGMLVMSVARMGCMVCVPLFMLLTGYLNRRKTLSGRYYLGLVKVVLTYLLASLVCILFRWTVLGEPVDLLGAVKGVLGFTGAPYAWYIEMYLGLFLLIPFLNLIYNGLTTGRQRAAVAGTMLVLTVLPGVVNLFFQVFPAWWMRLYPVAYYFLGAILRDFQPKGAWKWALPGFLASVVVGGCFTYGWFHGGPFQWAYFNDWQGATVVLSAVLLFLLLLRLPLGWMPRWLRWLVRKGAELSLGIYLVSWCFDSLYYPLLNTAVPTVTARAPWFFVTVPAVYLSSAVAAQVIEWIRRGITWCLNKAIPKLNLK